METQQFDVPVLLITFNRPDNARKVFESIRRIKPSRLYFFSDAPREGNEDDLEKVQRTREILNEVDWPCTIHTKFEQLNLGCGPGPYSAISWVFDQEDRAIILEDDCLPHDSFFSFCKTMLEKYQHDPRIMHIAGTRWNEEYYIGDYDFFYSSIGHIWGWATWRRAWKFYDYFMRSWNKKRDWRLLNSKLKSRIQTQFWVDNFNHTFVHNPQLKHAWDYQWQYTLFKNNGLAIVPNVNLISNIGVQGIHANEEAGDKSSFNRLVSGWKYRGMQSESITASDDFDQYHIDRYFMRNVKPFRKMKLLIKSFIY
ncbi:MAG: hypothetical protein C5B52_00115 [Bacteroidetes bacterium]|nr:MAG: hypothetical protein C5B52_00115 [Bacteroidota bacterium]